MDRFACQSVNHFYSKGRKAAPVIGFGCEEADGRLDKGVETFLGREISLVAGHRRPEQRRAVYGVVPGHTPHCRQLAADIILDASQFLGIIAPRHHITVATHGCKSIRVSLVKIAVNPVLVDSVAAAVLREAVHVPGRFLETVKILVVVVDKHILVIDVVARQQQSHGRGERKAAVASISR